MIQRLVFAVLALALVGGCSSASGPGRSSGREFAQGYPGPRGPSQATPYAEPLFEDSLDETMSRYALANVLQGHKVFWYNPGMDKVVIVNIKAAPGPDAGKPAEIAVAVKKRDGRLAMITAKAGPQPGETFKVYSAFTAPLDDNGQKLLEATYKEAYRRATAQPAASAPPLVITPGKPTAATPRPQPQAQPQAQDQQQAQVQGLPAGAPAGLLPADDLDFPAPAAPKQAPSGPPPGGKRGRGGGGMGGRSTGGGVLGGLGM
jgi:hypothetical protein